jgi:hypothetical protein
MSKRFVCGACAPVAVLVAVLAPGAAATPILMPTLTKALHAQQQLAKAEIAKRAFSIQPPAPPCPENGLLPAPLGNCGLPELPATGLPLLGNMAYWGGHVQVTPKVYIVYWGWGEQGAFPADASCAPENLTEGAVTATLQCDPNGAGRRMADFVYQLGGTRWAGVQRQYYETGAAGHRTFITNPADQLAGIWADDSNDASRLARTSASNPAGPSNTYTDLAQEAARAVRHFGITDLRNADIVIAQPENFSDPNAKAQGYCAFHDYVEPGFAKGIYDGITPGISYTNMPYVLVQGAGCGESFVNQGAAGKLDGFTIVLGHEIEETVTDPGAEDINGSLFSTTNLGAWYDPLDADENGDKCAYVGTTPLTGLPGVPGVIPIPGAIHTMTGNAGGVFAVQTLWSNRALGGLGYCAG